MLSVNRRKLLMWTAGSTVSVFLFQMLYLQMFSDVSLHGIADFMSIIIVVSLLVGFSSICSGINDKAGREAFLMLPATNMEKFLSLLTYATVIFTLALFGAYVAGDLLRMGVRSLMYLCHQTAIVEMPTAEGDVLVFTPWQSSVPYLFQTLMPGSGRFWLPEISFIVLMLIWIHSLYILAGTWLRKYAFVVASLVMISLPFILQYICVEPGSRLNLFVVYDGIRSVNPLAYVLDVLFVVFIIFNYWASFHIFKNIELITNKWTNYDIFKR